jgi:hypothetical protein
MNPFEFYSQVYGIDSFIVATAGPSVSATAESSTTPQPQPWIVFTTSLSKSQYQPYSEMFDKITAALGLRTNEFELFLQGSTQPVSNEAKVCVVFGGPQIGWQETNETIKRLVVSSLQDMAQNPELKKSAWSFLKQVMDYRRIDEGRAF